MRIQHNIMSMNAYRNYNRNTSSLSKNLEKLSSGYKINRAGDDAAGLAISEKMRAQITGLTQAQANAKSGINLVQTAEGAMQEVQDMLNRMVKLADQAANGTFDDKTDRNNLNKEVTQLKAEINRIADSANFNGIKLLDGSLDAAGIVGGGDMDIEFGKLSAFQASTSNANPSFTVDLDGLELKATTSAGGSVDVVIGSKTIKMTFSASKAGKAIKASALSTTMTSVVLGGVTYSISATGGKLTFTMKSSVVLDSSMTLNPAFNVKVENVQGASETASMVNNGTQVITSGKLASAEQQAVAHFEITKDMLVPGATIKIGDQVFTFNFEASTTSNSSTNIGVKDLLDANGELGDEDISEVLTRITKAGDKNGIFTVGNDGKHTITLQSKSALASSTTETLDTIEEVKSYIQINTPTKKGNSLTLQIGDTSDSFNRLTVSVQSVKVKDLKIEDVDISTQKGAQVAVDKIKAAIDSVSSIRGTLGATQNRLDHTISNLSVMAENIQDAESVVRDTDVAEEMMAYTKNNILVQSAQAMLAQANQVPQGVLQLLQ